MSEPLIILPVLAQIILAVILLFFVRRVALQRYISMAGSAINLFIAVLIFWAVWDGGILTMQAGNWKAPFGITFVADLFSSTMVLLTAIAALAVSIFSGAGISFQRMRFGYFPVFHFLIMGLNGAFLTGDIFNLYVWFEIIIIASFVLISLGGEKAQLEGAMKYVAMNLLASVIFLTAVGVLYGLTGSLNMAELSLIVAGLENRGLVNLTALLFLVGFGIKSAVFPLYFWLPASYHTPPAAVSAIFGGLLTKVGVYALLRVFSLIFVPDPTLAAVISGIAALTLVSGALGAIVHKNVHKVFSYLIICHIGFMIAGLGMFGYTALLGAIFYLIHDIVVKTNLFMAGGIINKLRGSYDMNKLGGMYAHYPKLSLLMAIPLFSLVGIPPLSGFWAKIFLVKGGLETNSIILIVSILFASFITLFVIAKMWSEVFWKNKPDEEAEKGQRLHEWTASQRWMLILPVVLLAAVSLYIGLAAENIIQLAGRIAAELIDTTAYIQAVLGDHLLNQLQP
jgi:multicomponent Na+:H+ antiporter subunit D